MRSTSLSVVTMLSLLGCAGSGSSHQQDGAAPDGELANPCGTPDPALAEADSAALFGATSVPTFDIYLPAESWEWLKVHAREETYVEADACYNGQGIGHVGLRFKGSYGSLFNCFDATGKNTCRKLPMKLKFDEYVDKQHFHGLKRLDFQSYRYDDSYLKERLSYDLFRAMGIVAPRAAWAKLRVNGEEQGLFGMVEQPDGPFVKSRFPATPDGNLYKEVWPGKATDEQMLSGLETNKDAPNISDYKAFSTAFAAATTDQEARAILGQYMDLDYMARYMAVDDLIADYDGPITYYTDGDPAQAGNHNFFVYEESPAKFTMIPWDLEATLSMSSGYGNVPPWQQTTVDCSHTYPVWSGGNQVIAPGCDRLFRALAIDLTAYKASVRTLLDTHFIVATMQATLDQHAAFIRQAASADPHGPGADKFEEGVAFLRQDLPRLRARLEHLVSGEPSTPLVFSSTVKTDFESTDAFGLISGTSQMCNAHSSTDVQLLTTDPLAGAKSCRIAFSFGDETTAYQQWMSYGVPMDKIPTDATVLTGIRLTARSNVARILRLDVDSPKNPGYMKGIRRGWDIALTATPKVIEVRFAEATTPSWGGVVNDSLPEVLASMVGLYFQPQCVGRSVAGFLPQGTNDVGFVDIDDLEFF
jgi:spore coat protein H